MQIHQVISRVSITQFAVKGGTPEAQRTFLAEEAHRYSYWHESATEVGSNSLHQLLATMIKKPKKRKDQYSNHGCHF